MAYGDPGSQHVLHRCDNPPCVNPAHLFLGLDKENKADMVAKKRSAWGEASGSAVLSEADVREIRSLIARGVYHRVIAERFGVSKTTVSDIHRKRSWYHLDS
jgi:FixJ family two-component response regulator